MMKQSRKLKKIILFLLVITVFSFSNSKNVFAWVGFIIDVDCNVVPADGKTTSELTVTYYSPDVFSYPPGAVSVQISPIGLFEETGTDTIEYPSGYETEFISHIYSQYTGTAEITASGQYGSVTLPNAITFYNIAFNPDDFPKYVGVGDNLNLSVTTNPSGTTGSYTWSKASGPGNVTLSPSGSNATFSGDAPGLYVVRCEFLADGAEHSYIAESYEIYVLSVGSVTSNKEVCWDGSSATSNTITFTATPNGATSFPDDLPVWSASTGSFIGGNSGAQVTWQAPSGSGGQATITATCGSSSVSETVTYVYIAAPAWAGPLSRTPDSNDSYSAEITHQPIDYSVAFSDASNDTDMGSIAFQGFTAIATDIIEKTHAVALRDVFYGKISAVIPDNDVRILFWNINFQKKVDDWFHANEVQDAQDAAALGAQTLANDMRNKLTQKLTDIGFSSEVCQSEAVNAGQVAEATANSIFDTIISKANPSQEAISEGTDFHCTSEVILQMGNANIIPPPEIPDIPTWIIDVNNAGRFSDNAYRFTYNAVANWQFNAAGGTGEATGTVTITLTYNGGTLIISNGGITLRLKF